MNRIFKGILIFLTVCALTLPLAALAVSVDAPAESNGYVDPKTPAPTTKPTAQPSPTQTPKPNPKSVKLNKTGTVELDIGETLQLKATVSPSNAKKKLTWSSSDKKIAKVDKNGLVTAVKCGVATITVKTHNDRKASVKVSVCASVSVKEGKSDVKLRLNGEGVMTVSGSGKAPKFTKWQVGAVKKSIAQIKEIVIKNGITELEDFSFWGLDNCQKVTIPGSVKVIGEQSFIYDGLKTVKLGNGVEIIKNWAFANNDPLKSVTVPKSVKELWNGAFEECPNLRQVKLSKGLRIVGSYAFYNDRSLKSIKIPSGVYIVDYHAFHGCTKLEEVELPKGLKTLGDHVFQDCPALKYVVIPRSVTEIGDDDDDFDDNIFGNGKGKKIFGYRGSAAEEYAEQCGIKFVAVG